MTVRDLINKLKHYDEDTKVVIRPLLSMYCVQGIKDIDGAYKIKSFFGDDFNAVVILEDQQCGSI